MTKLSNFFSSSEGMRPPKEFLQMVQQQTERLLAAQADILNDLEGLTRAFLARRREGAKAAIKATRALAEIDSPDKASQVFSDWVEGVSQRLTEDARDQVNCAMQIAARTTNGQVAQGFLEPLAGDVQPRPHAATAAPKRSAA